MKRISLLLILAGAGLLLMGLKDGYQQQTTTSPKDVHLSVKKVGTVWKVVVTGTTNTEVHVVTGQKVVFHAEGSDVYFQFDNEKLFGGHTRSVKNGKTLTLGVGNVSKGVYTYAAFCAGPKVFAQGDSPPKIIVD
jgi:hypothetical protein